MLLLYQVCATEGVVLIPSGMGSWSSFRGDTSWGHKANGKTAVCGLMILSAEGAGVHRGVDSNCSVDHLASIAMLGLHLK